MNSLIIPTNKNLIGKVIRLPFKLIPPGCKLPILQSKIRGKKWIVGSGVNSYWIGNYEYKKRRLLENIVKKGDVFFDVGAHVGFYTLLASELVGHNGKVISFEPLPRNIYFLKKHLLLNKVSNVEVVQAAISNNTCTLLFDSSSGSSMGHISCKGSLEVKTVSLDDLVFQENFPIPDCLKIDVEGDEFKVLLGAKTILKNKHPIIFLATHGKNVNQKCCDFLYSLNYDLKPILGNIIEETYEILAMK